MNSLNQQTKSRLNRLIASFVLIAVIFAPLFLMGQTARAAACATPSPVYGTDSLSINVQSTSTYVIWTRLKAPASSSNEILLQLDNSNCFTLGGSSSIPLNTWTWINYQNGNTSSVIQLSISAGTHTLKFIGSEPAVVVDRVELISGNSCIPQNTGDNCNPPLVTPPPPTTSSPSSSSTVTKSTASTKSTVLSNPSIVTGAGTVAQGNVLQSGSTLLTLQPSTANLDQINKVEYFINNKLVYAATKSPFSYKVNTGNLTNGRYGLTVKTFYLSGKVVSQTETLVVKHNFWRDAWLIFKKYLLYIFIIVFLLTAFVVWRRRYISPPGSGIEINLPPEAPPNPPTAPTDPMPPAGQVQTPLPPNSNGTRFPWR